MGTLTKKMNSIVDNYTGKDVKHGRVYMKNLLEQIEHSPKDNDLISVLAMELYRFSKTDDMESVIQLLKDQKYDEVRKLICSGDEHVDMGKQIFRSIYDTYKDYPTSEDYIKRIVDTYKDEELRKDKYKAESTELTILRQFLLHDLTYPNDIDLDKDSLSEDIFTNGGLTIEKRKECLVAAIKEKATEECKQSLFDHLDDLFTEFEQVKRRNNVEEGKQEIYKKWKAKINNAEREIRRKNELITLALDLAKGKIKQDYKTRRQLLDFAVAFNMKCKVDDGDSTDYGIRDINNSLFGDYYVNGVVKEALSCKNGKKKQDTAMDYESVAASVDLKNVIECIYVYYLNKKDEELGIHDKWVKIHQLIDEYQKNEKKRGIDQTNPDQIDFDNVNDTVIFKEEFLSVLNEEEESFKTYIMNFDIFYKGAAGNYNSSILNGRYSYEAVYDDFEWENSGKNNKLVRELAYLKFGISDKEIRRLVDDDISFYHDDYESFTSIFKELMLSQPIDIEATIDAIKNGKEEKVANVSRYTILNLLYFKFILEKQAINLDFDELYSMFDIYSKEYLEPNRYQPISKKNLFDVMIVLLIYINSYELFKDEYVE